MTVPVFFVDVIRASALPRGGRSRNGVSLCADVCAKAEGALQDLA